MRLPKLKRNTKLLIALCMTLMFAAYFYHKGSFLESGASFIAAIGGAMNATAVYANGGRMPVYGEEIDTEDYVSAASDTKVPWLCNRFFIFGGLASVGDIVVESMMICWFARLSFRVAAHLLRRSP